MTERIATLFLFVNVLALAFGFRRVASVSVWKSEPVQTVLQVAAKENFWRMNLSFPGATIFGVGGGGNVGGNQRHGPTRLLPVSGSNDAGQHG